MKTKMLLITMLLAGFTFYSCDSEGSDNPDTGGNYWKSNSLTRKQLKGNVKKTTTVADYGTEVLEFNQAGNLTSRVFTNGGYREEEVYTHENEQLKQAEFKYSDHTNTNVYEYNNQGKYITTEQFHLMESGLYPNLSSITNTQTPGASVTKTDLIFENNKLFIIKPTFDGSGKRDTSIVIYEGNYPKSHELVENGWGHFFEVTYYPNGMFNVYTEGFINTEDGVLKRTPRKYTFKQDDEYLLIESEVIPDGDDSGKENRKVYTYNDKKDKLKVTNEYDNQYSMIEDYSYVYDAQGNWTERTILTTYDGQSSGNSATETRTIEYW